MAEVSYYSIECLLLIFLLSLYSSTSNAQGENTSQPEVRILQGTLQGTTLTTSRNRNVSAFLGIPYAQPPIGNLRFADPVAAAGWTGSRNASIDANVCPQMSANGFIGNEDCLYLNVYTPLLSGDTSSSLLPVMVYIHGGGFDKGSGTHAKLGPEYILNEDVVLVILNYRLGVLGYLSTGDEVATGNWGLKDGILALQWVQDNIEYFGGDPEQVTLFGQSAGGAFVDLLALSNATIGLFHRCITQSGSALSHVSYRSSAVYPSTVFELGQIIGCSNDTSDSLINCMRIIEPSDIVANSKSFRWIPTDEPDILPDSPMNLLTAGGIRNIPQISGYVRDEALSNTADFREDEELFLDFLENIDSRLASMLSLKDQPDSGAAWVAKIKAYYLNDLTINTSLLLSNLTLLIGDYDFHYPTYKTLKQRLALGMNSQYLYSFNYRGTFSNSYKYSGSMTNVSVAHGDDRLYLFPLDPEVFSDVNDTMSETDIEMVDTMVQLWTSFARSGTLTASALNDVIWKPYSTAENYYLRIGNESDMTPQLEYYPFEERMQFWANLEASSIWEDRDEPIIGQTQKMDNEMPKSMEMDNLHDVTRFI